MGINPARLITGSVLLTLVLGQVSLADTPSPECKAAISKFQKKYEIERRAFMKDKLSIQKRLDGFAAGQSAAITALKSLFTAADLESIRSKVEQLKALAKNEASAETDAKIEALASSLNSAVNDRVSDSVREKKWTFIQMVCKKNGPREMAFPFSDPFDVAHAPRTLAAIKDRDADSLGWAASNAVTMAGTCPAEQPAADSAESVFLQAYALSPIYSQGATWFFDGTTIQLIVGTYDNRTQPPFLTISSLDMLTANAPVEGRDAQSALHSRFTRSLNASLSLYDGKQDEYIKKKLPSDASAGPGCLQAYVDQAKLAVSQDPSVSNADTKTIREVDATKTESTTRTQPAASTAGAN